MKKMTMRQTPHDSLGIFSIKTWNRLHLSCLTHSRHGDTHSDTHKCAFAKHTYAPPHTHTDTYTPSEFAQMSEQTHAHTETYQDLATVPKPAATILSRENKREGFAAKREIKSFKNKP